MEAILRVLLPRLLGEATFGVYAHQGKDDLLAKLPQRLRGYAGWLPDDWRIVVLVDRDDDNCHELKARLESMSGDAGLVLRSSSEGGTYQAVSRVAVEELEAWNFGDWQAVYRAYPRVPEAVPRRAKYRDPDAIAGGTCEAFERILRRAGYVSTGLRKIEAARAIAEHLEPDRNTSRSFQVFRDVLYEMASA